MKLPNYNAERKTRYSARYRHTLEIAEVCDFTYNVSKQPYGGFFDIYQLQKILAKIRQLEMQVAGLTEEKAKLIEGLSPHGHP